MIKSKLFIAIFLFSNYAFSFGGVVTDPLSYSYFATQIEQAISQLKTMEKSYETELSALSTAEDTYDTTMSIEGKLTGNYNRAAAALKSIEDMDYTGFRRSLQYAKKSLDDIENLVGYKDAIEVELDDMFAPTDRKDWVNVELERKASKQRSFKRAVIDAEAAQGKVELQMDALEELAKASNSTDSMKDAQDVTNALLLKMIENQSELITLMASISKNIALSEYDGKDEEPKDARYQHGKDITNPDDFKVKRFDTNDEKELKSLMSKYGY